jgi:hypothetical protein
LLEAKKFAKKLLKDELSDKNISSVNVGEDCAYLRSEKTFCLVKFVDQIENNFDSLFPESLTKVGWTKYIPLEISIFDQYLHKLELLKKECPVKGSIIFIVKTGEKYMISPFAFEELQDEFDLIAEINGEKAICFLTIFLNVPQGESRSLDELDAQKRVSLIYQVNGIGTSKFDNDEDEDEDMEDMEGEFLNYFFSEKNSKTGIIEKTPKYSEMIDEDAGQLTINLLYEISKNLKVLSKDLRMIKKILSEK